MQGWVKIYRKLLLSDTWLNSSAEQKAVLTALLLMVNHKEVVAEINGEQIQLLPGQVITSIAKIKERTGKGVSIQNIRTALKRFKKVNFLTEKVTKHYRLITLCNYVSYQGDNIAANIDANTQLTTNKNKEEIKEKREPLFFKKPISIKMAELLQEEEPNLYLDKEKDLRRLLNLSYKFKELIKQKKKKAGEPFFNVSEEEILQAFRYFLNKYPAWERANRFYPEYMLSNFSSIINKIRTAGAPAQEPQQLTKDAFKKIR